MPAPSTYRFTDAALRVGDAERDQAVERLREHFAAGRLTAEEFEERMAAALAARTRADLDGLFTDLPSPYPPTRRSRPRQLVRRLPAHPILATLGIMTALIVTVTVAAIAAGAWIFWVLAAWFFCGRGGMCAPRRPHHLHLP